MVSGVAPWCETIETAAAKGPISRLLMPTRLAADGSGHWGSRRPARSPAVAVAAPEIGDWGGKLKTWRRAGIAWDWRLDTEEKVRQLGWLINWHMPFIPIAQQCQQQFLNSQNWYWPDSES